MRGLGFWFGGGSKRNETLKLEDPRPLTDYGKSAVESGDAGCDGFSVLARANPEMEGHRPPVERGARPYFHDGGESFEQ